MNVLGDVLTSVHQVSVVDVYKRVPKLKQSIDELKKDILVYGENVYSKRSMSPCKKVEYKYPRIAEEIESLSKSAEFAVRKDIRLTITNLDNPLETLSQMTHELKSLQCFIRINDNMMDFDNLLDIQNYVGCQELLNQLENDAINIDEDVYPEIYNIVEAIEDKKLTLKTTLTNVFREHITLKECSRNSYIFKIMNDTSDLEHTLLALFHNKATANPLDDIIKPLREHFFIPILKYSVELEIVETYAASTLQINISSTQESVDYKKLLLNLELLVNFLKDKFNFKLNDELSTLEYTRDSLQDDIIKLLVERCSDIRDLEIDKCMVEDVEALEINLKQCRIFDEDFSLLKLINNTKMMYINKRCQEYIAESVEIMKEMNMSSCEFNKNLQCSVSCSVVKLLKFCEKILQEAVRDSEAYAGRLFGTVKSIIIIYGQFVPEYHRMILNVVPRQVALFYNDCVHIGEVLTEFNERFCHKLPKICCTFEVELHQIQTIASRIFANSVENEIKVIDSRLSEVRLDDAMPTDILSLIKNCVQHHKSLKSEWFDVLPYAKYTHVMGKILNSFITSFVSQVVTVDKLTSDAVDVLIEVVTDIRAHREQMFSYPEEVGTCVPTWSRLCELSYIFGANPLDIMNRWDGGKGPLAKQFLPDELRSLMSAIFPNSQERASILMKIT